MRCTASLSPSLFCIEYSSACSLSMRSTCSSSRLLMVASVTLPSRTLPSTSVSHFVSTDQSRPPSVEDALETPCRARFDGGSAAAADDVSMAATARAQSGM
eukprot:CAMPEP_0198684432 /NCGR_PEP_ID=MMETSP1468-20131203/12210_1 /TAXON_ID=1461545 /ORGANISM="Mantoniella sp, Strain CCMP1436" /LENGTH=100 /DNA_ID=CAMNT_0044429243 /DNA_START=683 /DNA_END=985 /DNA_ORIENTATION=+